MGSKAILFCASALLIQCISGQNCRRISVPSCGSGSSSSASSSFVSNNGGSLIVTSSSPIPPTGIAVESNLDLYGELDVNGCLPYLSAVQFETELPTSGSGTVDYSCGSNTPVSITSVTGGGSCGIY